MCKVISLQEYKLKKFDCEIEEFKADLQEISSNNESDFDILMAIQYKNFYK